MEEKVRYGKKNLKQYKKPLQGFKTKRIQCQGPTISF